MSGQITVLIPVNPDPAYHFDRNAVEVVADVRWFCSLRNHLYDDEAPSCKASWHRPNDCGWRFIGKMPSE